MKLRANLELSGFTDFGDILEGMPKILGVTSPRPRPLSEIFYFILVGRAKLKLLTKFEVTSFICFQDIVEGMPNILGVT